jgi:hypothetical protein
LGGFDFSSLDKPSKAGEVLSSRALPVSEAVKALRNAAAGRTGDARVFKINAEGSVEARGYAPDEIRQLMSDWRDHMFDFGRRAQALAGTLDEMHDPGTGGYQ